MQRRADLWALRVLVLLALAATLWLAGPKAYAVLAARVQGGTASGARVELDRVDLIEAPSWLRGPVLRAFLVDLEPRLTEPPWNGVVRLMDDAAARALRTRLQASPWILSATIERRFPDRFRVTLGLRRPLLAVLVDGDCVATVDRDGLAMPPVPEATELPRAVLHHATAALAGREIEFGERFPDSRVIVAAGVAVEWYEGVCPLLDEPPPLCEIDATNLGHRYLADLTYSQVLIGLGRADGGIAHLHYGLARADGGPVPPATKAAILNEMLAEYPGLRGIVRGDLRRRNLWRNCISLRETGVPDPVRPGR